MFNVTILYVFKEDCSAAGSGTICAVGGSRESPVMYICVVQCIAQSVSQPR